MGILCIISLISYLYILFSEKENEIKDKMISYQINAIQLQKLKIENWLNKSCREFKKIETCILKNPDKSDNLNGLLSILINQDIRYVFLVFQDSRGRYRFIGDGASEPAKVMQKIDPDNKQSWDESYFSLKDRIISSYANSDGLWRTYLSPFVRKNKTRLMLVTDFSISLNDKIQNTITPIKNILFYILGITVSIFIIGIIQMLMYFYAKKESYTDELTKLWNRNYLRKLLDDKISYNQYIIAMADIDFFKKINDQYGHDAGDIVLKDIAKMFRHTVNRDDFVFRYGGEEFLFLLQKKSYQQILDALMLATQQLTIRVTNQTIKVTISVGVNKDLHRYKHFADMIKSADIALYNAKISGRNQITYYSDSMDEKSSSNFQIVQAALDEDRIFCEYHKIVDTISNQVFKYEALVRIRGSDGTILYPNSFIEVIKNTNIYTDLTKRVIDIVCHKILTCPGLHFSINLGLQDFNNTEIINFLLNAIEKNSQLLDLMSIEVLENDKVDNEKRCIEVIQLLQDKGLKIAIDDFGSGYANFSTLLSYQFDIIKIDGAIIQKVTEYDKAIKIVESIVNFAKLHNMIVICEFVSSKEIYDILKSIGVIYMQGFYFSKPSTECIAHLDPDTFN